MERSLNIKKKRMPTKQKVSMKKETVLGLRTVKTFIQDYGGVDKVLITLDLVMTTEDSCRLYNNQLRIT